MSEYITTFRESYEDGSQLHESIAGEESLRLSDEIINLIGLEADRLNEQEFSRGLRLGMGLRIFGTGHLNMLPKPNSTDRAQPNINLFPIMDAFGKLLYSNKEEVLGRLRPNCVRALVFGPQPEKVNEWHADLELDNDKNRNWISVTGPDMGRFVVGVDGKLRKNYGANIQFADGDFIISNVATERGDCKRWDDLYRGYPNDAAIVARCSSSIISIQNPDFKPTKDTIKKFDDLVITRLGCTSLHAATPVPDSVRFSIQCFYDGLEKE
jgi:hypothetical protein